MEANKSIKRTLVTTADQQTWPNDKNESILFLGQWCKRFSQKSYWNNLDAEVLPYHWDDRKKLEADYAMLNQIYENMLISLGAKLNEIHETNHSTRYWRILIGPWLGIFIQILFDRWTTILNALDNYKIEKCYILEKDPLTLVPKDNMAFYDQFQEDSWNEAIYAQLLQTYFSDKIHLVKLPQENLSIPSKESIKQGASHELKRLAKEIFFALLKFLPKNSNYFFLSTYLSKKIELIMQIQLFQFPRIWRSNEVPLSNLSAAKRSWILDEDKSHESNFEGVVRKFIPWNIPSCYLEGYEALKSATGKQAWPLNPKVIFTANADIWDDIFKVYTAEKVEAGSALVIGQHGGNFGMTPFSFIEDHQVEICDKWLSWGWSDRSRPKITPVGNFKTEMQSLKYNKQGGALLVTVAYPRYSYLLSAVPIAGQVLKYFEAQKSFINSLPLYIKKQLTLRLYPTDYGNDQFERFSSLNDIEISDTNNSIRSLVNESRIYISTYNATTYLESLTSNVPTVIFWDSNQYEINRDAKPYFDLLMEVGIFHETPESASIHVKKVWDNISEWWDSELVQSARVSFCERYSCSSVSVMQNVKNAINSNSQI